MNSKQARAIILVVCIAFFSGCQSETVKKAETGLTQAQSAQPDADVQLERGVITAAGVGLPPKGQALDAQANLLARRAAITDAQRNLAKKLLALERRAGLPQSTDVTVKNYTIIEEKQLPDGGRQVVLEMKLDSNLLERLKRK